MTVRLHVKENFQQKLTEISKSKEYPKLLEEWNLSHIEKSEQDETCICGYFPNRKVYHITNHKNGQKALVGKECIKHILKKHLQDMLIALSVGKEYPKLLEEWDLASVEKSKQDETCICGYFPVREVCHITNKKNGRTALVDGFCVKNYFEANNFFIGTHKIFDVLKRMQKDINNSANKELINYGYKQRILDLQERDFYLSRICGKSNKKLVDTEMSKKKELNRRIIVAISQPTRQLEQIELDKEKKPFAVTVGNFYYIYGSGASQPNRKIEFWQDQDGKSGAIIFAVIKGKYELIGKLDGDNVIIENNSITDRQKAISASMEHKRFPLKPDSTLNKIPPERRQKIFSKLDPRGDWKVSIQNHFESKSPFEKVVRVNLFKAN